MYSPLNSSQSQVCFKTLTFKSGYFSAMNLVHLKQEIVLQQKFDTNPVKYGNILLGQNKCQTILKLSYPYIKVQCSNFSYCAKCKCSGQLQNSIMRTQQTFE